MEGAGRGRLLSLFTDITASRPLRVCLASNSRLNFCSNLLKLHAKHRNEIALSNLGRTAKPVNDGKNRICRPQMYIDLYGRRAVAIDRKQENALAVYNAQNIIKISNRKTFARQTDGLRIKFVNSKDDLF